jgi:hypothetical protein
MHQTIIFVMEINYKYGKISADRAKQIKTKAIVNEDPTEALIRELRQALPSFTVLLTQEIRTLFEDFPFQIQHLLKFLVSLFYHVLLNLDYKMILSIRQLMKIK